MYRVNIGQMIAKINELVEKHNALDIAFVKERRALQSDIKWYREELEMVHKNAVKAAKATGSEYLRLKAKRKAGK